LETSDKFFRKVAKEFEYLRELQFEIRLLTDHLTAKSGTRSGRAVPTSDSLAMENGPETDPDLIKLAAFRAQEREVAGRLEGSFFELAGLEFATLSKIPSAEELLEQSCSTVRSVIEHSIDKWNAVMTWNNNAANLLVLFSRHLGEEIVSEERQPSSGPTRVKILSDEAQARVFGVRINDREVRFVDKTQGIEHFQTSVLSAVES